MHILFVLMTFLPSIYMETLKYKINLGSFKFSMIIQLYNFLNSLIIEIFTSIPLFDYQSSKYITFLKYLTLPLNKKHVN